MSLEIEVTSQCNLRLVGRVTLCSLLSRRVPKCSLLSRWHRCKQQQRQQQQICSLLRGNSLGILALHENEGGKRKGFVWGPTRGGKMFPNLDILQNFDTGITWPEHETNWIILYFFDVYKQLTVYICRHYMVVVFTNVGYCSIDLYITKNLLFHSKYTYTKAIFFGIQKWVRFVCMITSIMLSSTYFFRSMSCYYLFFLEQLGYVRIAGNLCSYKECKKRVFICIETNHLLPYPSLPDWLPKWGTFCAWCPQLDPRDPWLEIASTSAGRWAHGQRSRTSRLSLFGRHGQTGGIMMDKNSYSDFLGQVTDNALKNTQMLFRGKLDYIF